MPPRVSIMHVVLPPDAMTSKAADAAIDLRRLCIFAAAATIEIAVASFSFELPKINPVDWLDPIEHVNAVAKVAIVAFCLLLVALWPRRAEMLELFRAIAVRSATGHFFAANIVLFAALLFVRFAVSQTAEPSTTLVTTYTVVLLATGASLPFLAAPPAFWWKLPKVAPVEIAIAIAGGLIAFGLGIVAKDGWGFLAAATLTVSHWILTLYETNVVLDADRWLLGAGDFSVLIYGPCSGYEGISLIVTFLAVYMWVFRRELRFPNVLLLIPLGMAAIWVLNALRIAVLVSIGAHISPEIAIQGFHSQAGWISFLFVTLGIVAASRRVPFFAAVPGIATLPATDPAARTDKTLAYLAPFMAMLAANIAASAFTPHDQWLYALKVVAICTALWWFRDIYRPLLARVSWSAVAVGLAVGVLWIATDPGRGQQTPLGAWIAALPAWTAAAWLAMRAAGSVVLVPVAEELAFRGFLARWLIATRFDTVSFGRFGLLAFVGSSLAFGLMHQRWLAAALAGAVYALLMYRSNRLSDPIVAHAVSNLAIVAWAVAAGQWSLL